MRDASGVDATEQERCRGLMARIALLEADGHKRDETWLLQQENRWSRPAVQPLFREAARREPEPGSGAAL